MESQSEIKKEQALKQCKTTDNKHMFLSEGGKKQSESLFDAMCMAFSKKVKQ